MTPYDQEWDQDEPMDHTIYTHGENLSDPDSLSLERLEELARDRGFIRGWGQYARRDFYNAIEDGDVFEARNAMFLGLQDRDEYEEQTGERVATSSEEEEEINPNEPRWIASLNNGRGGSPPGKYARAA